MHADTPEAVYGMPRISSSSWTVPSSPSRPCMATKATSGRSARSRSTRSASASIEITSCPSRSRASSTRAPDRSETWRSSERPPLRTATRLTLVAPTAWQVQDVSEVLGRRALGVGLWCRLGPGEGSVQADLLAHDLADAPDALADVVLA